MSNLSLDAFVRRWSAIRDRFLTGPDPLQVRQVLLVALWDKAEGVCHLCGGRVPHPILELDRIKERNFHSADHVKPKARGGTRTPQNLRLAHYWCNGRRGKRKLTDSLRAAIRAEAESAVGTIPKRLGAGPAGEASSLD